MSLTLLRILPKFGLYVTYRHTPSLKPSLETIPRIPNMLPKREVYLGLNAVGHYGLVRELAPEYKDWLLSSYFNPLAADWLRVSVYMWWCSNFTNSGGGGAALTWEPRSILTADNVTAEDEIHELAHHYEFAKTEEGVWNPKDFTEFWKTQVNSWPQTSDRDWAAAFVENPLGGPDTEAYNETYASTCSRIMGDISRLPISLVPYFAPLFSRQGEE